MNASDARIAAFAIANYLIDKGHGISMNDGRKFQSIILATQPEPLASLKEAVRKAAQDIVDCSDTDGFHDPRPGKNKEAVGNVVRTILSAIKLVVDAKDRFIQDIADHGIRCDEFPTVKMNVSSSAMYARLTRHFSEAIERVQIRARQLIREEDD